MRIAALVLAVASLAAAVLVGCGDEESRYHTLSFFFDGVPLPPSMVKEDPAATQPADSKGSEDSDKSAKRGVLVFHTPYERRQCTECHAKGVAYQVGPSADVCRKCHQKHYDLQWDDWVHGPVALGMCGICHLPHTARQRGLLPKPMREMCFDCHDGPDTMAQPHHTEAQKRPCTLCHDPHSAGNRLLLVDSTTFQRRGGQGGLRSAHESLWDKDSCETCHDVAKAYKLRGDVDAACVSCHKKVQQVARAQKLHKPIREGKCTACHSPHNSPLPHLIRPKAEKNCLVCHQIKEIQTDAHPPVRRAECLLCHTGHSAEGKHLLRPHPGAGYLADLEATPSRSATTRPVTPIEFPAVRPTSPATLPSTRPSSAPIRPATRPARPAPLPTNRPAGERKP